MLTLAKIFIIIGLAFLVIGGLLYLASRLDLPQGRLPGDIRIQGKGVTVYFPIVTMILISIVLTILLNIILRLLKR
jgi:hypothetical protein